MKPSPPRLLLVPLLLLAALAALLWLSDIVEHGTATPPSAGPLFSPPPDEYDRSLRVSLRPGDPQAQVVFAVGGAVPTLTVGTLYTHPLLLDARFPGVTVIRAREVAGGVAGPLVSGSYVLGVEHTLPILSVIADPADLWDAQRGILVQPWQRGPEWERPVHLTFVENGSVAWSLPAGLRVDDAADKPSLRLYFRSEYGISRLEAPLFPGLPSYKRLLLQAGDRSGRWTLLEGPLLCAIAADLGRPAVDGRFVLLFLNGESWGVYWLSERPDRFLLEDRFGVTVADLVRDGNWVEGDDAHWRSLLDWVANHDLSDPAAFADLQAGLDVDGFTDYAILSMYFGRPPEDFTAVRPGQAGGRWFWLYDDAGSLPAPEARTAWLSPEAADDLSTLLRALLANPAYRARFLARAADLLNTALSPDEMQARVDDLAAQLRPDIPREAARWPSPLVWEENVAALRDFTRRRPDALRGQLVAALGLRGTAPLTFTVTPEGGGSLYVNGRPVPGPSWSGTYFLDGALTLTAVPAPGYAFAGWTDGPSDPQISLTVDGPRWMTARFQPATDESALRPNDVIFNEVWINDNGTHYAGLGNRPITGDWLELRVTRRTVDLRGWRITDNDTLTGTAEGSLIFPQDDRLAAVPRGTLILIVATDDDANRAYFDQDDLDPRDRRMVLFVGNGYLDATTDPGFAIGTGDDNLALLAPGPTSSFADDVGVDFVAEGEAVTPFSFGVLADGVVFSAPFRGLGADDGALFTGDADNDRAADWIVDPPAEQSGDGVRLDSPNIVTPGTANYRQGEALWRTLALWGLLVILAGGGLFLLAVRQRRAQRRRSSSGR